MLSRTIARRCGDWALRRTRRERRDARHGEQQATWRETARQVAIEVWQVVERDFAARTLAYAIQGKIKRMRAAWRAKRRSRERWQAAMRKEQKRRSIVTKERTPQTGGKTGRGREHRLSSVLHAVTGAARAVGSGRFQGAAGEIARNAARMCTF
jgi:hypothetical protein